ncbi:HlyD family secretion protein [Pelotomaculum propionicicum]|uniref:Cobalt-zinc-cadmium resistance protein CzcB n=1 Tax=Pelotomaculum propionicicum TaxID=258475 RepID=A0A4Y7RKX2_9FIRM|nr:HlyD family efflux transporter periplasmic adaptor subunit [Pelotomaculum propionicicum]TEB09634.1 Cobalt-zinc-cadmium resistance protein CzcB [Pelotomaculum propionicicum]
MKKRNAVILLLAALGVAGYFGCNRYIGEKQTAGLQATGTIEATQVELRAKVAGTLQKLTLAPGDQVKGGQLVAEITRNDLLAQKERDSLAVVKAQAQLDDLTSGARVQEIKDAQIAVDTARLNNEKAAKDYDRAVKLYKEKIIADSEMEKAEITFKQSQNSLESAQTKLSLLLSGSRPDQIEAARVELERSSAVLKASEALLEDVKIICPIDGTVLTKNFENGEVVQAGASVATIANLNDMWIKVYIPTDDLPKIKLGQQVYFTVSGSSEEHRGTIEEIASKGEYTPKTIQTKKERTNIVYAVKIKVDNENNLLKPGMPADVVFDQR